MKRTDFHYDLPPELIAQQPLPERTSSRLLVVDGSTGALADRRFDELVAWLAPGDLLALNDTRVLPARLYGQKSTGGRVELLLERVLDRSRGRFQIRASKSPRPGTRIDIEGGATACVIERTQDMFDLEFDCELEPFLVAHGRMPLPPYIERAPEAGDTERYQTVFAARPGAVAAPTAGLHFDQPMLDAIAARGISIGSITLHVGAGTFSPVRAETIEAHRLHAERLEVTAELCEQIAAVRSHGSRVVAVGTTTVRALETAARSGELRAFSGESDLFIYPGFEFRVVDAIVTNFHLPESSLLMLVAAFAGYDTTMRAYRHAVAQRYRFFSYGDAMLLTGRATNTRARS
jgi:S-adenosylmethionine:tRNA ribosyltransferase-isomerase